MATSAFNFGVHVLYIEEEKKKSFKTKTCKIKWKLVFFQKF